MARTHDALDEALRSFIAEQPLFFVASAPDGPDGHVNLSPKGLDSFRVIDDHTVAYLDLTGSGAETIAHLRQNGRLTIMFCAFVGPPRIVRLYGGGHVHLAGSERFDELAPRFPGLKGARSIITCDLQRIQSSCGYAVPLMELTEQRSTLIDWAERRGPDGLVEYWAEKNETSIDGLPGHPGDGTVTPTGRRVLGAGAVWLIGAAVFRLTLLAPEQCPDLTVDQARAAAVASADWIVANQADSGRYLYSYDRTTQEPAIPGYNGVRHAGTTMALYQLAEAGETQYLDAADRAVEFMLERSIETGPDALAWSMNDADPKLGSVALLTVALAHRRLATGDTQYDETLQALGRHMVGQQQPDGVMLNYWRQSTGQADPTQRSRYATGEALWGLALLHDAFPDEGWDDAAWPILDYLSLRRDAEEELFPRPWPDQWAAYSLAQMGPWGLEEHHVAYARELAGQFGVQIRWDAQNEGAAHVTHGPITSAAGFGTVVEGLSSLYRLSLEDERLADLTEPTAERMACGAGRLADRQATADDVVYADAADQEVGAWFSDDATRVDDQQHAASGLMLAEIALPGGPS